MTSDRIKNIIEDGNNFLVASHENPDCDAVGSLLAMKHGLSSLGKNIYCYNKSGVPGYLRFLPGSEHIKTTIDNGQYEFDAVFLLDSADLSRVGTEMEEYIKTEHIKNLVIVDHHKTNSIRIGYTYVDDNASSTGILIYKILDQLSVDITTEIAKCLFTTIVGDTGSFRYSNTNPEALDIASKLVRCGADPEEISVRLYESEPERKIRLLSLILPTLEMHCENSIATLHVTKGMFDETGSGREDTEGVIDIARSIDGVKVAILFKEEPESNSNVWKVSIRSKSNVDVSEVAKSFGGGGHSKAAGFLINGSVDEARRQVIGKLKLVV